MNYQDEVLALLKLIVENTAKKERKATKRDTPFKPPNQVELGDYIAEIGADINPSQFIDFYASKGWKVGNNKMKDWRAAVRTWKSRDGLNPHTGRKNETTTEQLARYEREEAERAQRRLESRQAAKL